MSVEARWYSSYSAAGEPPKMRRLCRQPMGRQWAAAIDLAIAHHSGEAGYRPAGRIMLTGEEIWLWPQPDGQWWLIPHRVSRRCFALIEAAIKCGGGDVGRRLRIWRRSGHWRRIAATIHPRHGAPAQTPFQYKASRGRPKKRGTASSV
jgi:hypothetical protein